MKIRRLVALAATLALLAVAIPVTAVGLSGQAGLQGQTEFCTNTNSIDCPVTMPADGTSISHLETRSIAFQDGTFRYIVAKTFRLDPSTSDVHLLADLIAHKEFQDD